MILIIDILELIDVTTKLVRRVILLGIIESKLEGVDRTKAVELDNISINTR